MVNCETQQEVAEYWAKPATGDVRVTKAMLGMKKVEIAGREAAYRG